MLKSRLIFFSYLLNIHSFVTMKLSKISTSNFARIQKTAIRIAVPIFIILADKIAELLSGQNQKEAKNQEICVQVEP